MNIGSTCIRKQGYVQEKALCGIKSTIHHRLVPICVPSFESADGFIRKKGRLLELAGKVVPTRKIATSKPLSALHFRLAKPAIQVLSICIIVIAGGLR
jgi:hypothetical protein